MRSRVDLCAALRAPQRQRGAVSAGGVIRNAARRLAPCGFGGGFGAVGSGMLGLRPLRRLALLLAASVLTPSLALAEVPKVVTDIAPVQSLVAQVMEGLGEPGLLMDQGADAHHFSLRPSQARALQQADLVVWIGPEMTPWLGGALAEGRDRHVLSLLSAEGTERQDFAAPHDHAAHADAGHADHDHAGHHEGEAHGHEAPHGAEDHAGHDHAAHDHGDDDHAGHDHAAHDHAADDHAAHDHAAHEGHSHEGTDPHAWLNPANAVAWLDLIAAELSALDPENAARYRANAETARRGITELDARIAADLAPHAGKPFVVAHDAYGYFAKHFGLHLAGAIAGGDAAAPGAARLKTLREELKAEGAVCAFPEVGREARLVALVVEGSETRLGAALDPEGREIAPGPALYGALISRLSEALVACLSVQR